MVNGALNGKTIILTLQNYNILGTLSSLSPIFFSMETQNALQPSLPSRTRAMRFKQHQQQFFFLF